MTPRIVFCLVALFTATSAAAALIPLSEITVDGDFCTTCPFDSSPELSIDGDFTTKWTGKNNIRRGEVNVLAYRFERPTPLTSLELFMMNRREQWVLGELDIQVSSDTTDGFDGSWLTIASRPGDTPDNIVSVDFPTVETSWLRLHMEYQGRGASGSTPAFGLHEIQFHRAAVPEPGTLLVLGAGVVGLFGFTRRHR